MIKKPLDGSKNNRLAKAPVIWVKVFSLFIFKRVFECQAFRLAASHSFWFVMAIVPLCFLIFAILSKVPFFWGPREILENIFSSYLHPQITKEFSYYISELNKHLFLIILTSLITFGLLVIILLLDVERAFKNIFETTEHHFLGGRFLAVWVSFTLGFAIFASLFFLSSLASTIFIDVGWEKWLEYERIFTLGILTISFVLFFSIFYKTIAHKTISIHQALVGGVVSGSLVSLIVISVFCCLTFLPSSIKIFNPLIILPVLLILVYCCFFVLILGGVICSLLANRFWEEKYSDAETLHSLSLLIISLQILGLLLVSSQKGDAVSKRVIAFSLGVGEDIIEKAIAILSETNFIKKAETNNWVLSRDLSSAPLQDLCEKIGFDIKNLDNETLSTSGSFYAIELWRGRLVRVLGNLNTKAYNQDEIYIRDVLEGRKPI